MRRLFGQERCAKARVGAWLALVTVVLSAALAGCSSSPGGGESVVPGTGQEFVTGDVASFQADDAQVEQPLATPFTLTSTVRGEGSATIENALVNGKRSTISWSSGLPLPISGSGGLDLGAVHLEVDAGGVTWGLDGTTRNFVPGDYTATAPVAVGSAGLAATRDSVSFQADVQTVLISRGGVIVQDDPQPLKLTGPGKISVSGNLRVQTPDDTRRAGAVTFGPGPFEVTLTPGGSTGVTMKSILQGNVTTT